MTTDVKTMQINIDKENVLHIEYFISDISEKPDVVDVILRFDDPKTEKKYQISQREFKHVFKSNPNLLEEIVTTIVKEFFEAK